MRQRRGPIPDEHGAGRDHESDEQRLPDQQAPPLLQASRIAQTRDQCKQNPHLEHPKRRSDEGGHDSKQRKRLHARGRRQQEPLELQEEGVGNMDGCQGETFPHEGARAEALAPCGSGGDVAPCQYPGE